MRLGIAVVGLSISLAGCAIDPSVKPWYTLKQASFAAIRPGITDKSEVRNIVGKAKQETTFARLGEEVWDYYYLEGTTRRYIAEVHFDVGGKAKYTTFYQDPADDGAGLYH